MAARYIERSLEPVLRKAVAQFPAVVLTGPRQSGKTTLLRHVFGKDRTYVSLEPPDVRAAAAEDPRGFLDQYPSPVIFDEVQYAPDLLAYVKERIDEDRDRCGRYVLTGSQNLLRMAKVTESLAGRAAMLRLLPLSRREADGRPEALLPWERAPGRSADRPGGKGRKDQERSSSRGLSSRGMWESFLRGDYPELVANPGRDINLWHAGYVQTYLERDVRTIRQGGTFLSSSPF